MTDQKPTDARNETVGSQPSEAAQKVVAEMWQAPAHYLENPTELALLINRAIQQAIAEERESCADIVLSEPWCCCYKDDTCAGETDKAARVAAAIRARKG